MARLLPRHPKDLVLEANKAKGGAAELCFQELFDVASNFLKEVAVSYTNCPCLTDSRRKETTCCCFRRFHPDTINYEDSIAATARFMAEFVQKSFDEKRQIVAQWILYSTTLQPHIHCRYILPVLMGHDPLLKNGSWICQNAVMAIAGIGTSLWKTSKATLKYGRIAHGNAGRPSNNRMDDGLTQALHAFFNELRQSAESAEPAVAVVVDDAAAALDVVPDDDDDDDDADLDNPDLGDVMYLPSTMTKRRVYARFARERGWEVKTAANGSTELLQIASDQNDSNDNEVKKMCTWGTFHRFWSEKFPDLLVSAKKAKLNDDTGAEI